MDAAADEVLWRRLAAQADPSLFIRHGRADDGSPEPFPLQHRVAVDRPRPWRRDERRHDGWAVTQRMDHPDGAAANELALDDLDGGADGLVLVTAGSPFARGFGIGHDALAAALDGVELDLIGVRLDAGRDAPEAAACLATLIEERRLASAALPVDLGYDPIGLSARDGGRCDDGELAQVLDCRKRAGLAGAPLLADGRPYHEAGASDAQELGAVLATGLAYLRRLEKTGVDLADAFKLVAVLLPADANVARTLARMRAMRRLWACMQAACGLAATPLRLHAETSWRMMTRYDPWSNVMRSAAACAAAGLGGADTVTVLPATLPLGLPDGAARRLARNSGRVLIDEARLAEVDDPAGGAGSFEALTLGLCEQAWSSFQEIEAAGGIEEALRRGSLQAAIARSAERRADAFACLDRALVGTSRYPDLAEHETWGTLAEPARPRGPTLPHALTSVRDAEPFEVLRDRAETCALAGARPTILLATLGGPADFGARANQARNIFAIAGVACRDGAMDIAAQTPNQDSGDIAVACLCGSDAAYAADGAAAIAVLRHRGAKRIGLVSSDRSWLDRGVDWLIGGEGAPVLPLLNEALDVLLGGCQPSMPKREPLA